MLPVEIFLSRKYSRIASRIVAIERIVESVSKRVVVRRMNRIGRKSDKKKTVQKRRLKRKIGIASRERGNLVGNVPFSIFLWWEENLKGSGKRMWREGLGLCVGAVKVRGQLKDEIEWEVGMTGKLSLFPCIPFAEPRAIS